MPLLVFAYLALGVVAQCALWSASPDWLDTVTWQHVLLWPGFAADRAAATLSQVRWLWVALAALLLMPVTAAWLARRA